MQQVNLQRGGAANIPSYNQIPLVFIDFFFVSFNGVAVPQTVSI
jgi:hypothetical protein